MKITIECQGFSATDSIRTHAREQVRDALHFVDQYVDTVDLCLHDVSGPNGPAEYNVVARLALPDTLPIVVEGNGCDLSLTVRYTAGRAQRAVERSVQHQSRIDKQLLHNMAVVEIPMTAASQLRST